MKLRLLAGVALILSPALAGAEGEPPGEESGQNAAVSLFERLVPGLKIESIGEAEMLEDGGTRFVGENDFEFTTKSGETIRATAGAVAVEPSKNLVTLSRRPAVRMRTHGLIATADETRITYRTDTGKVTAAGPHRIAIGGGR